MQPAFLSGPGANLTVSKPVHRACHSRPRRSVHSCVAGEARAPAPAPPVQALEDRDVPVAHRGLHDTLYAGGAEAEHGAPAVDTRSDVFTDTAGLTTWGREEFLRSTDGQKVAGVYGVLDSHGELAYVGFSRNIALALKGHISAVGSASVQRVRVRTFTFPKRAEMEQLRDQWINENGSIPPGNNDSSSDGAQNQWSATATLRQVAESAMSEQERQAFEEKKFKLRKAMADPGLADELDKAEAAESGDEEANASEMRRKLRLAVEGDDWSGEVNAQTENTLVQRVPDAGASSPAKRGLTVAEDGTVISPFAEGSVLENAVSSDEALTLCIENVDRVLDEVRPYLLSDGGNISVVSIALPEESGAPTVTLQLEGACGTCPSSTMTMQLGVERVLREKFGDAIGQVIAISDPAAALKAELSVEACERALDEVRASVTALGGNIAVLSATAGQVEVHYTGPSKLAYAIEHLLKEKVPNVRAVAFT
jgi:Fe-S cluster biogenesis protein NfuA